ncbi:MAG: DUF983 domain-containing protein [Hyphomicrobiaceae bacterium]
MNEPKTEPSSPPSPLVAGLTARCPRCGQGALFRSGLILREKCERCGLSYAFADAGDGPAVFAIFILGFLVLAGALWVEFRLEPPVWVHVALWGVLTPLLALALLRVLKAGLIALQYKHKAGEGGLEV